MIIERYNSIINEYECYDDRRKWVAYTGYGKTKEDAKKDYFKQVLIKKVIISLC